MDKNNITNIKALEICWYLIIVCIGVEYLSKPLFLLEIVSIIGLILFFKIPNFYLNRKDIGNILIMSLIMLGVIISRINVSTLTLMLMNLFFLIKMFLFFLFVYFYLTRFGFPFKTLYVFAFFAIPHFLGYILGLNLFLRGQFCGFHGDPNYLSPDLLSSFLASLILVNSHKLNIKVKVFFSVTLFISLFLLLLTVSRTAFMAMVLMVLILIAKSFFSRKRKFLVKAVFATIVGTIITSLFLEDFIVQIYNTPLYDRFFSSQKGADLLENERYFVWGLSYSIIQENGLFQGYGIEEFLKNKYHFVSHNAWLDIGIKQGSYTFWIHSIIYVLGIIIWCFKYFKNSTKIHIWSNETFMLIFACSISFMMFSISVSHMYYYWFILFIIFVKGILPMSRKNYSFHRSLI